ncbi:hypothetical protein BD626DRAFT_571369 [Schizophyllum amplum]|uniref:Uncharacterized protein n=1 Tax=Schizophyllum amplum TaxID=97359 RepID=A0A550C863_9AGAR|nr:hypothetical protein BD626DRAFT_571369 [Auriculariopsis ampla]
MASSDKGKTVLRTVPPPLPSPATGSANPASSLQALWPYIAPALDHIFTGAVDDPARAPSIDVLVAASSTTSIVTTSSAPSTKTVAGSVQQMHSVAVPPLAYPARSSRNGCGASYEALRTWGWDPAGEPASRSAAEASAEAGSAPDRVIPVNTLALRRFRTEVVDPLLAAPKPKGKKKGKKKPGAEPRGRLARAVKALLEPAEEQENVQPPEEGQESAQPREAAQGSSSIIERVSDEERLRLVQDLANMLRAVGVRPDHLLRKKLDGYLLAHAASVKT